MFIYDPIAAIDDPILDLIAAQQGLSQVGNPTQVVTQGAPPVPQPTAYPITNAGYPPPAYRPAIPSPAHAPQQPPPGGMPPPGQPALMPQQPPPPVAGALSGPQYQTIPQPRGGGLLGALGVLGPSPGQLMQQQQAQALSDKNAMQRYRHDLMTRAAQGDRQAQDTYGSLTDLGAGYGDKTKRLEADRKERIRQRKVELARLVQAEDSELAGAAMEELRALEVGDNRLSQLQPNRYTARQGEKDVMYQVDPLTGDRTVIASGGAFKPEEGVLGGVTKAQYQQGNVLRDDYRLETDKEKTIVDQFARMSETDPTGAGDIKLLYSFMKSLDPTSVVRESEFATARDAGGAPQKFLSLRNQIMQGTLLSPAVRADMRKQAGKAAAAAAEKIGRVQTRYGKQAEELGIPEYYVFGGSGADQERPAAPVRTGATGQPAIPAAVNNARPEGLSDDQWTELQALRERNWPGG